MLLSCPVSCGRLLPMRGHVSLRPRDRLVSAFLGGGRRFAWERGWRGRSRSAPLLEGRFRSVDVVANHCWSAPSPQGDIPSRRRVKGRLENDLPNPAADPSPASRAALSWQLKINQRSGGAVQDEGLQQYVAHGAD